MSAGDGAGVARGFQGAGLDAGDDARTRLRHDDAEIVQLVPRMREIAPGANRRLLLRAMQLYGGFAELNYVFDNARLRSAGLGASPASPGEMKWDFK